MREEHVLHHDGRRQLPVYLGLVLVVVGTVVVMLVLLVAVVVDDVRRMPS